MYDFYCLCEILQFPIKMTNTFAICYIHFMYTPTGDLNEAK